METNEFPNNSKAARQAAEQPASEKKIEQVISSGEAVRRKKSLGRRFREFFITSEDPRGVFEFLWQEHISTGIRDLVFDTASAGLERKLYGDSTYRGGRRPRGGVVGSPAQNMFNTLTNYGSFSSGPMGNPNQQQSSGLSRQARRTLNFGEVVIPTKLAAEGILTQMFDVVEKFEEVTVADFMQMMGEVPDFMHEKYGWTDLRGSRVVRARGGGYTFSLPPTEELA